MLDDEALSKFKETIWQAYAEHGRPALPWRQPKPNGKFDPYHIMVSEIMLQQTQVSRVIPKYHGFLTQFPDITSLSKAPLGDVLRSWSGLGYNRRAKFLHLAAQRIQAEHCAKVPDSQRELSTLPGIGKNTAGAILAYAYNQPVVFIETNIRTVFIHHFFQDTSDIPDRDLLPLIEVSLEREQPREWYWALMDYGAHLKQTIGNLSRHSRSYVRQSAFTGSRRQARGQVLRLLTDEPQTMDALQQQIAHNDLSDILHDLIGEQLIHQKGGRYSL